MANGDNGGRETIRTRITKVLSDGQPHTYEELFACFDDELVGKKNLADQIGAIRTQIHPVGQDIVCTVFNRRYHYQQVRFLLDGPTPLISIRRGRRGN